MEDITYRINDPLPTKDVVDVLVGSGINRPVSEPGRIAQMFQNADVVVSAWHGGRLVGVSRALTDWCYCCYLSDLAVHRDYQKKGIGREMITITRKEIGNGCMLLLLAAPSAMDYYPLLKMEKLSNAFMFHRIN